MQQLIVINHLLEAIVAPSFKVSKSEFTMPELRAGGCDGKSFSIMLHEHKI